MAKLRVGVVGASGYSGSVAARLIAIHPHLVLAFGTSDKLVGESLGAHLGVRVDDALRFVGNGTAIEHADSCDAVMLATSAEVSMRLAPAFAERGKQVIDLSGAFRLEAGAYPRWYGFEHAAPAWLARAHYGLPELFGRAPARRARRQPGLLPDGGAPRPRAARARGPHRADRHHRRRQERRDGRGQAERRGLLVRRVRRRLARVQAPRAPAHAGDHAGARRALRPGVKLTFTAHYLPVKRGLLATCYARPLPGATAARVAECLADAYGRSGFVRAMAPDQVMLKRVVGTNACHVGATANDDVVVAVGAIDNLLKGAAGQAVQNLNLMNGWDETHGPRRVAARLAIAGMPA